MSHVIPGDEDLHHCDNSHRWTAGPGYGPGEKLIELRLREHLAEHAAHKGEETSAVAKPRVPWSH